MDIPYVYFMELSEYEVTYAIKKPKYVRTKEVVKASSVQNAKELIYAKFGGKDNVSILGVKKVKE